MLAAGRALTLSVREYSCFARWCSAGRIVSRDDLYATVWGRELREGDRSIDVYVHKLRVKLETALPAWRVHPYARGLRLPLLARVFTPFSHQRTPR